MERQASRGGLYSQKQAAQSFSLPHALQSGGGCWGNCSTKKKKKYGWLAKYNLANRIERPKQNGASRANGFDFIGVHAVGRELEKWE